MFHYMIRVSFFVVLFCGGGTLLSATAQAQCMAAGTSGTSFTPVSISATETSTKQMLALIRQRSQQQAAAAQAKKLAKQKAVKQAQNRLKKAQQRAKIKIAARAKARSKRQQAIKAARARLKKARQRTRAKAIKTARIKARNKRQQAIRLAQARLKKARQRAKAKQAARSKRQQAIRAAQARLKKARQRSQEKAVKAARVQARARRQQAIKAAQARLKKAQKAAQKQAIQAAQKRLRLAKNKADQKAVKAARARARQKRRAEIKLAEAQLQKAMKMKKAKKVASQQASKAAEQRRRAEIKLAEAQLQKAMKMKKTKTPKSQKSNMVAGTQISKKRRTEIKLAEAQLQKAMRMTEEKAVQANQEKAKRQRRKEIRIAKAHLRKMEQEREAAAQEEEKYAEIETQKESVWAKGYADYERRDNISVDNDELRNDASKASAYGFMAGRDWTVSHSGSAVVPTSFKIGAFAGYHDARTKFDDGVFDDQDISILDDPTTDVTLFNRTNTEQTVNGAFLGLYGSYVYDKFTADLLFKADIYDSEKSENRQMANPCGDGSGSRSGDVFGYQEKISFVNYIFAANFARRYNLYDEEHPLEPGYSRDWFEPIAGLSYTFTDFGTGQRTNIGIDSSNVRGSNLNGVPLNRGLLDFTPEDGHVLRLQIGTRLHRQTMLEDGSKWTTSLTALLYIDVLIDGYVVAGITASIAEDEGKIRALARLNLLGEIDEHFSLTAETEVRGGQDYFGVGGKLGFKYKW